MENIIVGCDNSLISGMTGDALLVERIADPIHHSRLEEKKSTL